EGLRAAGGPQRPVLPTDDMETPSAMKKGTKMDNEKYDVIVVGGGTAGAIAAIASARTGARTLVVEKQGYLGGILSLGMHMLGTVDYEGYWALGGVGRELVRRLVDEGFATA